MAADSVVVEEDTAIPCMFIKPNMETSPPGQIGRGLWNCPRATQYSKETEDMLKLMMQESRLTNFQQRQIKECLKKGVALPLTCNPTSSAPPPQSKPKIIRPGPNRPSAKPLRRTAESCRSGDSYIRERFRPSATRDLEKEKRRLQSILATGEEEPKPTLMEQSPGEVEQKDRFQEVLDEIEERRQFLADMTALGKEKHYQNLINSEISQKIRELEVIDKARSAEMKTTGQEMEKTDLDETEARK